MNRIFFIFIFVALPFLVKAQDSVKTIDPNTVQINGHVHQELPKALLKRIKYTTDTFEIVDGISYEKAIDMYKRDLNPEENLEIWEEMARVYNSFCASRCSSSAERKEVYRALLLRSMFSSGEALVRLQPIVLSPAEAKAIISGYQLPSKPIDVMQK